MGINQKEIAERAEVSQSTVSLVLNNDPRITKETRKSVLKVIEELDYRPDSSARSLAGKRTGNIGFILCDVIISNPFFFKMLHGVDQEVSRQNRKLLYTGAEEFLTEKSRFPLMLKEKILDGAIVSGKVSLEFVNILKDRKIPRVVLGNHELEDVDIISADVRTGSFDAVSYLISLGHTRIGFMTGSLEYFYHRELLESYRLAHEKAGLDCDEELIRENIEEDAGIMVERMFKIKEPPTAIFAVNDIIAVNAMEALKERGFKIPDDISIIGIHDIDIASYTTPRLTTVKMFHELMAEAAVKRLMEIIDTGSQKPVRKTIRTELVIRDSCAYVNYCGKNIAACQKYTEKEVNLR